MADQFARKQRIMLDICAIIARTVRSPAHGHLVKKELATTAFGARGIAPLAAPP